MKILLIFLIIIALLSTIKDKYYIKLLQTEIEIRDDIIKELNKEV